MNKILFTIAIIVYLTQNASAQLSHYDIDFSEPEHSLGSTPSTGTSINLISKINFGNPLVQDSFGSLNDRALVFTDSGDSSDRYDQIELEIDLGYTNYKLEFDMCTQFLRGSIYEFSIFLDTPTIQKIAFKPNGQIELIKTTSYFYRRNSSQTIGYFQDNQYMHVEIDVDLITNLWTINTGGLYPDYSGTFYAESDDIDDIRFSFGRTYGSTIDTDVAVGIDNIKVTTAPAVPEPGVTFLFSMGSVFYGFKRLTRFRKK